MSKAIIDDIIVMNVLMLMNGDDKSSYDSGLDALLLLLGPVFSLLNDKPSW